MTAHEWRDTSTRTKTAALEECARCGARTARRRDGTGPRRLRTGRGLSSGPECPETCEETAVLLTHTE